MLENEIKILEEQYHNLMFEEKELEIILLTINRRFPEIFIENPNLGRLYKLYLGMKDFKKHSFKAIIEELFKQDEASILNLATWAQGCVSGDENYHSTIKNRIGIMALGQVRIYGAFEDYQSLYESVSNAMDGRKMTRGFNEAVIKAQTDSHNNYGNQSDSDKEEG